MPCSLCRGTEDDRPNRIGGLDLCRRCHDGGAVAAAHARGFGLEVECSSRVTQDHIIYEVSGRASLTKPLFDAKFVRNGVGWFWRLLGRTIRVQDPLFHEIGTIVTRDPQGTRRFIDADAAQSAVMDLLGEEVNVEVRRTGNVRLSGTRKDDPFDQTAIERELAVLLVHLDGYE